MVFGKFHSVISIDVSGLILTLCLSDSYFHSSPYISDYLSYLNRTRRMFESSYKYDQLQKTFGITLHSVNQVENAAAQGDWNSADTQGDWNSEPKGAEATW